MDKNVTWLEIMKQPLAVSMISIAATFGITLYWRGVSENDRVAQAVVDARLLADAQAEAKAAYLRASAQQ